MSGRLLLSGGLVAACTELLGYSATGKTLCPVVLLVEPQWVVPNYSTLANGNNITAGAWTPTGVTTPGVNTMMETAANSQHMVVNNNTATTSVGPGSYSADLTSIGGRQWCRMTASYGNTGTAWFDLTGGVVGGISGAIASSSMSPLGGGAYRCSINGTDSSGGYVTIGTAAANNSGAAFAGDITMGLTIANVANNQISCAALLNMNGDVALRDYGSRLDASFGTKAGQPVVVYTWNGRMALAFSGANQLRLDALAPLLQGNDVPMTDAAAFLRTSVASAAPWAMSTGAGAASIQQLYWSSATGKLHAYKTVGAAVDNAGPAFDTGQHIVAHTHTGTTETMLLDGAATAIADTASNVNATTLNTFTLGGRFDAALVVPLTGLWRAGVFGLATLPTPQLTALSQLVKAYAG